MRNVFVHLIRAPHYFQDLRWIGLLYGLMIDIGLTFFSVPSPPFIHSLKVKVTDLEVNIFLHYFQTKAFDQQYRVTPHYVKTSASTFCPREQDVTPTEPGRLASDTRTFRPWKWTFRPPDQDVSPTDQDVLSQDQDILLLYQNVSSSYFSDQDF